MPTACIWTMNDQGLSDNQNAKRCKVNLVARVFDEPVTNIADTSSGIRRIHHHLEVENQETVRD